MRINIDYKNNILNFFEVVNDYKLYEKKKKEKK